jgi:protein-L-isoaspartate(D-aspartate) O-methyltransferase
MQESLAAKLIRNKVLKSPHVIESFLNVDRMDFVLPEHQALAYEDSPLSIGADATISQPTTVAFMLELLQPQAGQKILDVGAGSGWTTAILADIAGEKGRVIGTELEPILVDYGRINLEKYNFENAEIWQADKILGAQDEAPFDRILVSAMAQKIPQHLIDQLDPGGIMVLPVLNSIVKVQKLSENEMEISDFPGFVFVPLR